MRENAKGKPSAKKGKGVTTKKFNEDLEDNSELAQKFQEQISNEQPVNHADIEPII